MNFFEKYIKLRSITKMWGQKWGLKKITTKNNFTDWLTKIKMSGKISPEFQWTDDDLVIELNNYRIVH